jgi:hypothetical protein
MTSYNKTQKEEEPMQKLLYGLNYMALALTLGQNALAKTEAQTIKGTIAAVSCLEAYEMEIF